MTESEKAYDHIITHVAAQAAEIQILRQQLNDACQDSETRINQLARQQVHLDDLAADIHQIERYLEYHAKPQIKQCLTELRTLAVAACNPIPDIHPHPQQLDNQP